MRQLLILIICFWTIASVGQNLEKGIFRGEKLPFTICYLTYTDSTIEVEYFYQKGGQIFAHDSAIKLNIGLNSFSNQPAFVSTNDSIKVFVKQDYFLVKRLGIDKIKVYRSTDSQTEISILRNRNKLQEFSQRLFSEVNQNPDFNEVAFWKKLHSYELENQIKLTNAEFDQLLDRTEKELKN